MPDQVISTAQRSTKFVVNASILRKTDERDWYVVSDDTNEFQAVAGSPADAVARFMLLTFTYPTRGLSALLRTPDNLLFHNLVVQWHKERGATSSISEMAMCPSYQRIIAMGPTVIPLILRRMESEGDEPDMWFWALRVLTDVDPISESDRGDIAKMARAWLRWAQGQYVW
jgi:hypothetical protein